MPADPFTESEIEAVVRSSPAPCADSPVIEKVDMTKLLAQPDEPIPYVVDQFAARGCVTVLAGKSGIGKSFLALAIGASVAKGRPAAGMDCEQGGTLYLDGENGPRIMTRRFRALAIPGDAIDYRDVRFLDISRPEHVAHVDALIAESGASFVVLDALKRLTPAAREGENDDMAPVMAGIQRVARDRDVAILVLHHQSVKAEAATFRGASAIQDQCDILFGAEGSMDRIALRCHKFRIDEEPDTRFLAFTRVSDVLLLDAQDAPGAAPSGEDVRLEQLVTQADAIRAEGGLTRDMMAERFGCASGRAGTVGRIAQRLVDDHGWTTVRDGRSVRYCPPPPF
jgi:AAA domain